MFPAEKRFEKKERNTNTICLYLIIKRWETVPENYFKNEPGNARDCDNS